MTRRKKVPLVDLGAILLAPVKITVEGKARSVSPFEAAIEQCVAEALGKKNIRACARFIRWCLAEGIVQKAQLQDEYQARVIVPRDWTTDEFYKMYCKYGPPPWPGKRDGLTDEGRAERKLAKRRARR